MTVSLLSRKPGNSTEYQQINLPLVDDRQICAAAFCGEPTVGGSRGDNPLVAGPGFHARPEKGMQGAKRTLEGGTRNGSHPR
ncbi:MAG: hypothetical protein QME85_10170 [Candidatus Saccharicenans sp.]|nr:hypothetical protein [Candidatus Saccharicenans sp.]MDI6849911.1 hypothetical protein [Candidatus Saccharicenans sp.]